MYALQGAQSARWRFQCTGEFLVGEEQLSISFPSQSHSMNGISTRPLFKNAWGMNLSGIENSGQGILPDAPEQRGECLWRLQTHLSQQPSKGSPAGIVE